MRILRINDILERTGLSAPTIWRLEKKGLFPKRIKIGAHSVGWRESEVSTWISNLPTKPEVQSEK